jgi:hypothetical protein
MNGEERKIRIKKEKKKRKRVTWWRESENEVCECDVVLGVASLYRIDELIYGRHNKNRNANLLI